MANNLFYYFFIILLLFYYFIIILLLYLYLYINIMPQKVKGKRILKNGVTAGYVKQKDGSWRFRFLKGSKKKKKKGGYKLNKGQTVRALNTGMIELAKDLYIKISTGNLQVINKSNFVKTIQEISKIFLNKRKMEGTFEGQNNSKLMAIYLDILALALKDLIKNKNLTREMWSSGMLKLGYNQEEIIIIYNKMNELQGKEGALTQPSLGRQLSNTVSAVQGNPERLKYINDCLNQKGIFTAIYGQNEFSFSSIKPKSDGRWDDIMHFTLHANYAMGTTNNTPGHIVWVSGGSRVSLPLLINERGILTFDINKFPGVNIQEKHENYQSLIQHLQAENIELFNNIKSTFDAFNDCYSRLKLPQFVENGNMNYRTFEGDNEDNDFAPKDYNPYGPNTELGEYKEGIWD